MNTTQIIFQNYNETVKQISVLEDLIEATTTERKNWWIGGRMFNKVPMDNAANRVDLLSERIKQMHEALDDLKERKRMIDDKLGQLDGLEYKVAYKRFVEGKTLQDIADELDRSHEHIRRISSKLKLKNATPMLQTS